jgi:hypothetical protein
MLAERRQGFVSVSAACIRLLCCLLVFDWSSRYPLIVEAVNRLKVLA